MFLKKYLIKVICVVLLALGVFACSTPFASANKIQNFFRNHSIQGQTIFEDESDAQRAYDTLLNFCDNDEKNLDQVHDIKKLAGGLSGAIIFAFILEEHNYVGRLFAANHDQEEMLHEVNAQSAVADIGYAPKIYLYDLQKRSVIMDLVQGKNLNDPALIYDESLLQKCALALRAIHSVSPVSTRDLQIREYTKNRIGLDAQQLIKICAESFTESIVMEELLGYVQQLCDVANSVQHAVALTHNDFHCGNILVDNAGSIKIIDWTDAGYDNLLNDCAILLHEYVPVIVDAQNFVKYYFSSERRQEFLTYYLGRDPLPQESAWLRLLCSLYRIEVMAKIISNSTKEGENKECLSQDSLKKSIDLYLNDGIVNEEPARKSEYTVLGIKLWIEEIKRYITQELDEDKKILRT